MTDAAAVKVFHVSDLHFGRPTVPEQIDAIEQIIRDGAFDVVAISGSLSDRSALRRELESLDAEVVVVEIKAAAIDVVAEEAARRGIEVVLAGNDVVPLPGEADLDGELERLAVEAIESAMVSA